MTAEPATVSSSRRRTPPRADVLLWLGVWVTYAAMVVVRSPLAWFPVQDQAVLDLRVRDLLEWNDPPTSGAFSRYGWSHPGPAWFYLLAPFRWAFGGPNGLLYGSTLLFGAGIATFVTVVRSRFGDRVAAAAAVVLVAPLMAAGSASAIVPWNPYLAYAWLPVFLLLCVTAVDRRPRDLAPACFVGALLVQLHIGYAVLVAGVWATSFVIVVVRSRPVPALLRRTVRSRSAWSWGVAAAVAWLPAVLGELHEGGNGNLRRIARFFVDGGSAEGAPAGWSFAIRLLGGAVRLPLNGLGGHGEGTDPFSGWIVPGALWWFLIPLAVVGGSAAVAVVHRDARAGRVVVVCCAILGSSAFALSRVVGERWSYLFVWRYAITWFALAACVAAAIRTIRGERPAPASAPSPGRRVRSVSVLVAGVLVLDAAVALQIGTAARDRILPLEPETRALARQVIARGEPRRPVEIVRFGGVVEGVGDGLINVLDARGWPIRVPGDYAFKYGPRRASPADTVWFATESSADTTIAASSRGARVIASWTPLGPRAERRLVHLQRQLIARLAAIGRLDLLPAVDFDLVELALSNAGVDAPGIRLHELARLNKAVRDSGSCRCAVVRVAPTLPTSPVEVVASTALKPG